MKTSYDDQDLMNFNFSDYSKVVYDTNCIIYYRLNFSISFHKKKIKLTPTEFPIVEKITSQFLNKNYTIHILKIAFDEILKKDIAVIIQEYLIEKYPFLKRSGLMWIAVRNFETKATKSIQELKNKGWFCIVEYLPSPCLIEEVRNFYKSLPDSPAKQKLTKKNKDPYPDDVDISLIIYSKTIDSPLLTNDRDIYDFKTELGTNNHCEKIIALPDLVQSDLS